MPQDNEQENKSEETEEVEVESRLIARGKL